MIGDERIAMTQRRKNRRLPNPNADRVRSIFRLLGSDLRCNMLIDLAAKPTDASALATRLRCAPSTARRTLQRLTECRMVTVKQPHGKRIYRLSKIVSVRRDGDMVDLRVDLPNGGAVTLRLLRPIDKP